MMKKKFALVTASKGTLLRDLLSSSLTFRENLQAVVTDRPCGTIDTAVEFDIPVVSIEDEDNERFSDRLCAYMISERIGYAILAFPRLLKGEILQKYRGKLFNTHPSILPAYKGFKAYERAMKESARFVGNTIHVIDKTVDAGPVVIQSVVQRSEKPEYVIRHEHYVQQCKMVIQLVHWMKEDRLRLEGKRVVVQNARYHETNFAPNLDAEDALFFEKKIPPDLLYAHRSELHLPEEAALPYRKIAEHYEACLTKHGDTPQGVDWENERIAGRRYDVMLDIIREPRPYPVRLLDFGCGAAHFLDYIRAQNIQGIDYQGVDISHAFIDLCRQKYPEVPFLVGNILQEDLPLDPVDYVVINGVFTVKLDIRYEQMFAFFTEVLTRIFEITRKGMAFNLMPKHVDWEKDRMFHVSLDVVAEFLTRKLSRHFVIRNDYGLYEYTVFVHRQFDGDD